MFLLLCAIGMFLCFRKVRRTPPHVLTTPIHHPLGERMGAVQVRPAAAAAVDLAEAVDGRDRHAHLPPGAE